MTTDPSPLARRALLAICRHGMLRGGERVLVAVSGGPDSVALLDVLREVGPGLGLELVVAHVHHGLRPAADGDAAFVQSLSARWGLACHVERVTVRRAPPWEGPEAEARRARQAALRARAHAVGAQRIATGHTADDQAETVLMRLLQGAGPRGLGGIAPVRDVLIRPLIDLRRAEVLAHLAERGLDFVEDETNRDRRMLRNRLRHDALPALGALAGGDVAESLCRAAAACRALVADLERRAEDALDRLARPGPAGLVLDAGAVARLPEGLGVEVLLLAARRLGEPGPQRGAVHQALARALRDPAPRRPTRLGRLAVERSGARLRVGPRALPALLPAALPVPGRVALPAAAAVLQTRCFPRDPDYAPPRHPGAVAFDADRLAAPLVVRPRRAGERFAPFGGAGRRRLKSVLIDAGVPRWDRPRLPLVEAGGEVVWIPGVRRGRAAPVTPETRRILEVTVSPL